MSITVAFGVVFVLAALAFADYHTAPPPATQTPAQTAKVETQLKTAIEHARNAAGSNTLNTAVTHLGHVLNCIEGTRGKNFNASWGHVCQGQGDGILVDIKGERKAGEVMVVLDSANTLALSGVKIRDLEAVQNAAKGVAGLLQVVMDGLK